MAIDPSTFSVPGVSRVEPWGSYRLPIVIYIVDKIPPTAFTSQRSLTYPYNLGYTTVSNNPLFEGQVCVYYDQANEDYPNMYIVIDIDGTLTWKIVDFSAGTIDPSTGKAWDPLASFYTPLAR